MHHPQPAQPGSALASAAERPEWQGLVEVPASAAPSAAEVARLARDLRLPPWHRRLALGAALGLAASGLLWMAAELALALFPDLDGSAARARMHAVLVLHGVLGYAGAVVLGSLLARHIPAGLRSGRRRATGIASLALAVGLVVTALALYYVGSDGVRGAASAAHQVLGAVAVVVVGVHVLRREAPRGAAPPDAGS